MATHAIESSTSIATEVNNVNHEGVAERHSIPRAIPVNHVNNDDNHTNNNVDSNEAIVAEAGEANVANDDVNTNDSNEVGESRAADLTKNPSNQVADPPRDVICDDELFSKTVQIDKNAGNDEVAESDDDNDVIDKNNANLNDAEVNKANVATHIIESALPIEDNKADKSYASPVTTHAIESSNFAEAIEVDLCHARQDVDGTKSFKDSTSNDKIFDDDSTCSESNCGRYLINYYDPIHVSGHPQGLREATVLAVDPDDEYPLTLSTCDTVLKGSHVNHITKY